MEKALYRVETRGRGFLCYENSKISLKTDGICVFSF